MRHCFYWLFLFLLACGSTKAREPVPAYLIRLPPTVTTAFVAETSKATFHHFEITRNRSIDYRGSTYMSIGENGDGKQRDGDRRTPLGIYFVTEQLDTERMHEKYGVTAFTLDYPNAWDKRLQRTGDGIWVHGVDRRGGQRPPLDTDGCIALPNSDLTALSNRFLANTTPVVIARTVSWVDQDQVDAVRSELEQRVVKWAGSWQSGELHTYLSLYHDDFRHWQMNKEEWTALHAETFGLRAIKEVLVSEMLLLGDPAEDGLYLSRFLFAVTEGSGTMQLTKRLYWRRTETGELKIIAEDSG